MARVTVEDCIDKVENRFDLVLLASHRARMISSGSQITIDRDNDKNPVVSLREIAETTVSPGDLKEDLFHSLQKYVDVDEPDVGKVRPGLSATFGVDAFPDRRFPATIRDVRYASETIQGVVTYKAVLSIDNSELLLRPGMTATAEIKVEEVADALLVANAALRYAPAAMTASDQRSFLQRILPGRPPFRQASRPATTSGERTVWVLENGKPIAVPLRTGATDGRNTEVKGGELKAGQAVIIDQTTTKP